MPPAAFDAPFAVQVKGDPDYHRENDGNSYGSAAAVGGHNYVQPPLFPNHVLTPAAARFRNMLINTDKLIICPGVHDGLSARVAHEVGFEALYMTGAGTSASRLGQPDLGIAQLAEMRYNAEMIANLKPLVPLVADMDTGFGGPIMIDRAVT